MRPKPATPSPCPSADSKDTFGNADTKVDDNIAVTMVVTNMEVPASPELAHGRPQHPGAAAGLTVTWAAVTAH